MTTSAPTPGSVFGTKPNTTPAYRVFTVTGGRIEEGATIDLFTLKGAGITIPAVIVGEEGRGRKRGVMPVLNPPFAGNCPNQGSDRVRPIESTSTGPATCPACGTSMTREPANAGLVWATHPATGKVPGRLMAARIGTTKAGKPRLEAATAATTDEKAIIVFRVPIGYRGGNSIFGDITGWKCGGFMSGCGKTGDLPVPSQCDCGCSTLTTICAPFPGQTLVTGHIAQGAAGRMGVGTQIIALVEFGQVIRTGYTGRLYGGPSAHYVTWDGERVLALTQEERDLSGVF